MQIGNQQFTLADRMKSNHVNGVSIALIKDYKIEWAKGYGWADSAEQRPITINTDSSWKNLTVGFVLKQVYKKMNERAKLLMFVHFRILSG